ncbi:MAG: hypothetical protein HY898_10970 [Deltaproteobacteria bacterium]|nr:hypothetical protein [Deltaproteobacteria bacterium]
MSFQVPSWDGARVIRLTLTAHAQRDPVIALREAMRQLPDASQAEPGSLIAIPATAAPEQERGFLGRFGAIGPRVQIHRATRCTCLLARGYVRIAAGRDAQGMDWAWGYAP